DAVGRLAAESGRTQVELAYQWVAARPGVDSILLGPASVEQLDAAIDAVAKPLPKEVIDRADELYRAFQGTDASYARSGGADRRPRCGRRATGGRGAVRRVF